ncbi:MAG TPA: transaldolase [Acidimicrobiales bacterium]|nr:transaldolase [Acidimicrobiales bacterium]
MTKLHDLYEQQGQSPWIDNIRRAALRDGTLARQVSQGIRGVTSNPTIFAKAIEGGSDYDEQFSALLADHSVEEAYWDMTIDDIVDALEILRPVHEASDGTDGWVSIEVAPALAHDTAATIEAARRLHELIARPNLYVKIPGTAEGIGAVRAMIAEGRSINVTLLFSVERHGEVIEAYLAGLEDHLASGASDLSGVHSVASFFVSRVDTEVDRRIEQMADGAAGSKSGGELLSLRGKAAVAQARVAYQLFEERFRGPRWEALAAKGARVQRPLWASTSTKNPAYPDLAYVDTLIGPDTVNTMPDQTVEAFLDHGTVARTVDSDPRGAKRVLELLGEAGIDMDDVARTLEDEGVASFTKSFDEVLQVLTDKASALAAGTRGSKT